VAFVVNFVELPLPPADRTCQHRPARPLHPGAHPVIGFSEVQLTEQTLADYADTLAYLGAYLGAAIRLYRDTFRPHDAASSTAGSHPETPMLSPVA
jgi:hypothetical protein